MRVLTSGTVNGVIRAPASKSMMQRAVVAATLARGKSTILAPSLSDDGKASLQVAQALGAHVTQGDGKVEIKGGGVPSGEPLRCGESGTSIRIFSAVSALYKVPLTLEAEGSLINRPMRMIEEPLRTLGANVQTTDGHAPLTITGPLRGGNVTVDGSTSSQFLSGLLMTLPGCKEDSHVLVPKLKSKPYVHMTLELLRDFGIEVQHDGALAEFSVRGGQAYTPREYTVEGDWSGASFLLVAGAISGKLTVSNLRSTSSQADRAILEALKRAGAGVHEQRDNVTVEKRPLQSFEFDASECPDLFPPLVALAACCKGTSTLHGVLRLAHKESDRGVALKKEFGALGIEIELRDDVMKVTGGKIHGARVFSHHDHRIAMACGIAALVSSGPIEIEHPECVAKSFPDFYQVIESLKQEA